MISAPFMAGYLILMAILIQTKNLPSFAIFKLAPAGLAIWYAFEVLGVAS